MGTIWGENSEEELTFDTTNNYSWAGPEHVIDKQSGHRKKTHSTSDILNRKKNYHLKMHCNKQPKLIILALQFRKKYRYPKTK